MASRFVLPFADVGNGITPEDGAKLFFFATGTSTPKDTFSDEALTTANTNPVIADADGVFSDIWMPDGARYKVQLKDKNDVQQWEADPVIGGLSSNLPAKTFDNVAAMVAATELLVGDIVDTAGYNTKGDGGNNQYEVVAAATGTDDGGSFIDLATLQAKGLFPGGVIRSKQFDAKADGVTDDRNALFNADAFGPANLNSGTHLISSALTFTDNITFESGAIIKPSASITVAFNSDLLAGDSRIFDLSNASAAVANLKNVNLLWFTAHLLNTTTDATTEIQDAYDACVSNGVINWPVGFLTKTGSTATTISKGEKTVGHGPFTSEMRFSTAATNGFSVITTVGAEIRGISTAIQSSANIPTSGICFDAQANLCVMDNIIARGGFDGIRYVNNNSGKCNNFEVQDVMNIGVLNQTCNDNYFSNFIVTAPSDYITMTGVSGTFVAGETVTGGTSGATGTITEVVTVGALYRIAVATINFTSAETMTGGTSAATGTFSTQQVPHALGGLRLAEKAEAVIFSNGDVIGGTFAITTTATVDAQGVRPAYCRFSNVYFDSADSGASFDKSVGFEFSGGWFSNRPGSGCTLNTVDSFSFNGTSFINSWTDGLVIQASATSTIVDGCKIIGNNASGGSSNGISVAPNAADFVITNSRIGGTLGFGTQNRGVLVNTGSSDRYIIADNLVSGNTTAGVTDAGTGVNKRVADNY